MSSVALFSRFLDHSGNASAFTKAVNLTGAKEISISLQGVTPFSSHLKET